MAKRPSGTLAMMSLTVLLIGAFAGVARLDRIVRTPRIAQYDYTAPQLSQAARSAADQGATATGAVTPPAAPPPAPPIEDPEQKARYDADRPKSIIELQPFRKYESGQIGGIRAALINLNPTINAWFLLTVDWAEGRRIYHLENPDPIGQQVHLSDAGLTITAGAQALPCDITAGKPSGIAHAISTGLPYAPLCEGRLQLRNRVAGHYTDLERITDFLRENVWSGDEVVGFVKQTLYQDAFRETVDGAQGSGDTTAPASPDALPAALLRPASRKTLVAARDFGLEVQAPASRQFSLGQWYPVQGLDGAYASLVLPQAVDGTIFDADKGQVNALDDVEASSLVHMTAFDLSQFELKFAMGTDHPRLNWSPRAVMRDERLPGPDGVNSIAPVVTNGIVSPTVVGRIAATFAGGFKREHGAFKWGELSRVRYSSHYGFVEHGVIFSKLQPGLATLYVLDDGSVHLETWIKEYDRFLPHVVFARQNGVALVELDAKGNSIPGAFVDNWGAGNWSGSADAKLRTLRAGVCLIQSGTKQYLVHGLFTTATPSAMAVVFQSYGCRYGMLLDMNALEHSYLALFARKGDKLVVEHPVAGMMEIDRSTNGKLVPRFVGYPDNRDFFYLVRRKGTP